MVPLSVSTLPFCVSDIREQCMNRGLGKQKTIRIRASIFWVRFSAVGGKFVPGKLNFINWFYSSKSPDHSLLLQPSKWCKTSEAREPGKVAVPRTNGLWNENAQPTCSAWPPHSGELQLALAKTEGEAGGVLSQIWVNRILGKSNKWKQLRPIFFPNQKDLTLQLANSLSSRGTQSSCSSC